MEIAPLEGGLVLFNPDNNKFCQLNRSAAFLWEQLSEPKTIEQLAGALCGHYPSLVNDTAVRDITAAVGQLCSAEVVGKDLQ